jgi:hypothetical protein
LHKVKAVYFFGLETLNVLGRRAAIDSRKEAAGLKQNSMEVTEGGLMPCSQEKF